MLNRKKSTLALKVFLLTLICALCVLFAAACSSEINPQTNVPSGQGANAPSEEMPDMTIRKFRATETGVEGYSIVEQNGMAVFYKLEVYDNDRNLQAYITYDYNDDGNIRERRLYSSTDGHIITWKYERDNDGKLKSIIQSLPNEGNEKIVNTEIFVEKGKEHLLEEGVEDYCVLEYDKFGRITRWVYYVDGELSRIATDEYNMNGLVKETIVYVDGREDYVFELTPME